MQDEIAAPQRGHRHAKILLAAVAMASLPFGACSDDDGGASSTQPTRPAEAEWGEIEGEEVEGITLSTRGGIDHLASQLDGIDSADLALIAYLHRNWEIDALRAAPELALERVGAVGASTSAGEAIARRLVDAEQGPPTWEQLDGFTLPGEGSLSEALAPVLRALYCDAVDFGSADARLFEAAIDRGGYSVTHAALALSWSEELGCRWDRRDQLIDAAASAMSAELQAAAELGADGVNDLTVQLASVLVSVGGGAEVPERWVEDVMSAQQPDGGWASEPGAEASDWHTTLHAVWFLLQVQDPGVGAPVIPGGEATP